MNNADNILIIGAGPSGLTLATALTRRRIGYVIVDKAAGPAPMRESKALAFNVRSQAILAASGVTDQIVSAGHSVKRIQLCWHSDLRKELLMPPAIGDSRLDAMERAREATAIESGSIVIIGKKYGPKLLSVPFVRQSMKRSVSGLDTPRPEWLA